MNPKKGLVGKEPKPAPHGAGKPGLAKGGVGPKGPPLKEPPTKGAASRNLLSLEDVCERLRVSPGHVEDWLKDGLLKGSVQGVQLYELEKFRAKHHRDIVQAQSAPPPSRPSPPSQSLKSQGKKARPSEPVEAAKPEKVAEKPSLGPLQLVVAGIKSVLSFGFGRKSAPKPEKVAPYVQPPEDLEDAPLTRATPVAPKGSAAQVTANIPASQFRTPENTGELVAPLAPSSEVWPSLEGASPKSSEAPSWLTATSVEPVQSDTLIMKSDQILAAMKAHPVAATPATGAGAGSRELQEEKQRNQQLLLQLQEQRRAELELQDELETLKQRLDLSLNSEREVRSQLKKARQELQTALEELEQRPPAGGADPEELKQLQAREAQWLAEKDALEQQRAQLDQRRTVLEQQIERLRSQAEEIRQHGLQWHQLATQQDQQLKTLRQQHIEMEQEAGKALGELEKKLRDSESQRARAETLAEQAVVKFKALEAQLEQLGQESGSANLALENKAKDKTIQQLQQNLEQVQAQMAALESQQRTQVQRWEQELQASASWVQKLTEAVTVRDKKIQELESQLAQSSTRGGSFSEEELKSQVMSLRVELTSLRRNYEIVSLQAKNLEAQLLESRRQSAATPPPAAPAQTPVASGQVLSLNISPAPQGTQVSSEEEGGFRRRLRQRLGSLSSSFEEESKKGSLEPPPFLELDIPES